MRRSYVESADSGSGPAVTTGAMASFPPQSGSVPDVVGETRVADSDSVLPGGL